MTPEGKVKAAIRTVLDAMAPELWYFMPSMNGYGKSGVPDFVGCYRGRFFAIEAKSDAGKPTPWQVRCLDDIASAKGSAFVFYSVDAVERDLLRFLQQCS